MSGIIIPSSEADRKIIRDATDEIFDALVRIESLKDHIKDICETVQEKTGLSKKHMSKLGNSHYKQNLETQLNESSDLKDLYDTIMESKNV